jgi:transposase
LANLVAVLNDAELPDEMKAALRPLVQQIEQLSAQIAALEKRIVAAARQDPVMRLLTTIRGVGAITGDHGACRRYRGRRPQAVPLGAGLCRLVWADTAGVFERRQAAREGDQPAGRTAAAQAGGQTRSCARRAAALTVPRHGGAGSWRRGR